MPESQVAQEFNLLPAESSFPKSMICVYLLQEMHFLLCFWHNNGKRCPLPTQAGLGLALSSFRVFPAQLQSSGSHQAASQGKSLNCWIECPKLEGKMREGWLSGREAEENFPAQSAMVLRAAGTFAAPCHYWGITGPSVQLLSLPSPTNANQNPTQAAKIFRGFYKTNFNNPFKCFFRIEHEFAKSRVAYSS